ncbi:MAG: heme-copper oxidase subunit III [Chthoniobacter sp.]|nr:heme-copper oxidase subunit III [Chthoniobacter sp.]
MQIPHEVTARPDTGLYNAKLGIWLFLASEVMLFGGLFSAYIFLRMGAEDGYWPHGLLNVPVGAGNTAILIASSVTVVLAWASLKMRKFSQYKLWMGISILCGALFLIVKLAYEWPQKFEHFGAFIKKDAIEHYEKYLGNHHLKEKGLPPRVEISGHLHEVEIAADPAEKEKLEVFLKQHDLEAKPDEHDAKLQIVCSEKKDKDGKREGIRPGVAEDLEKVPGVKLIAFELGLDPINAAPDNPESDKPHFLYKGPTETPGKIERKDVEFYSSFAPKHSSYFAVYFTITGLHGLHVLAGVLIMLYFWLPIEGGANMFKRNPEHLANRVEVVGLFWHFVDLVWIFVFPIFYLL